MQESAEKLGPVHAAVFMLGADMGLRPVDMCRLTQVNALEFLSLNGSMIRGKGRNGGKVAWQKANKYAKAYIEQSMELRAAKFLANGTFLMWTGKFGPKPMNQVDEASSGGDFAGVRSEVPPPRHAEDIRISALGAGCRIGDDRLADEARQPEHDLQVLYRCDGGPSCRSDGQACPEAPEPVKS